MENKKYKLKIGLEIHIGVETKTKVFSRGSNVDFKLNKAEEQDSNIYVNLNDIGMAGTLPLLNEKYVETIIRVGRDLNCSISRYVTFDRKHYSYLDIPIQFQLTQKENPFCKEGYVYIGNKKVRIKQIHLECDAGSLYHHKEYSLLDLNKCGTGLLELVTYPDLESASETITFLTELTKTLPHSSGGMCKCQLWKGKFKFDLNLSIGNEYLPDNLNYRRQEIKNLNFINELDTLIDYEYNRLSELLDKGIEIKEETRGYNGSTTYKLRSKEKIEDYRYMPEFNIPPLFISEDYINSIEQYKSIKEKTNKYNLTTEQQKLLIDDYDNSVIFINLTNEYKEEYKYDNYLIIANLIINNYLPKTSIYTIDKEDLFFISDALYKKVISNSTAKYAIDKSFSTKEKVENIINKENLFINSNINYITNIVNLVIEENKDIIKKQKPEIIINFIFGKCIKKDTTLDTNILKSIIIKNIHPEGFEPSK